MLIKGNEMITANVGDSEIVLCRGGKPLVLSTAHNMMKNTAEEQRVKDAGGVVFRSRLGHPYINPQLISIAVTRSIGDITFKDTDFTAGRPSGIVWMYVVDRAMCIQCALQYTRAHEGVKVHQVPSIR